MKTRITKTFCLAALCAGGLSTATLADQLTPAEFARIKASYAEVLQSMNDGLPASRMAQMQIAYRAEDPSPRTDSLSPHRMAKMHKTYDSLKPIAGEQLALK